MTQKIPCPECGELNYESSPACWKCGAALKLKPAASPATVIPQPLAAGPGPTNLASDLPDSALSPQPSAPGPQPPAPGPQPSALATQPSALGPQPSPKPAELEAAALTEKEFVTPPVDVEEKPTSIAEWLAYGWAAIASSGTAFREALNDYDTRRGRRSGGVSSYGCVLTILVCTVIAILAGVVVSFLGPGAAR